MSWEKVGRDVKVDVALPSLHPETAWVSDNDDLCVLARGSRATARLTWTLTEQGNDEISSGELEVPVATPVHARDLYLKVVGT